MASLEEDFFRAFASAYAPLLAVLTERTPPDMITGPANRDGYVPWRMLPCTTSLADVFERYAQAAGQSLPPSFQRWYATMFTLDGDCAVVRLPENPSNAPGKPLLKLIMPHSDWWTRPLELGLLPFGDESNDSGPLCFDARAGGDPDSWPVRYWDHDCPPGHEIGGILFSSFTGLLRGVTAYLRTAHVTDEPQFRAGIEALIAADPEGAGGPGRKYWIGWSDF